MMNLNFGCASSAGDVNNLGSSAAMTIDSPAYVVGRAAAEGGVVFRTENSEAKG
jgi:hypothetical protein